MLIPTAQELLDEAAPRDELVLIGLADTVAEWQQRIWRECREDIRFAKLAELDQARIDAQERLRAKLNTEHLRELSLELSVRDQVRGLEQ